MKTMIKTISVAFISSHLLFFNIYLYKHAKIAMCLTPSLTTNIYVLC